MLGASLVVLALAAVVQASSDMYFLDWSGRRMLSISTGSCHVHDDSNSISWMVERAPYGMVRVGDQALSYMMDACSMMYRPQSRPALFIYPGTKWCGSGSLAQDYHELGPLHAEDRCCRDHDFCPSSLHAGECRNGLCNPSSVTRSHCECDLQFRRCLQEVGSAASHALGALYFNIAQVPCFSEERRAAPSRVARLGFSSDCHGPYSQCYGQRYQYHRLGPYSLPLFSSPFSSGPSYPYNSFSSVVPSKISSVLFGFFRVIGVV